MKKFWLTISLTTLLMAAGCVTAPVRPPVGILFTLDKAPLTTDFHGTDVGTKMGTARTMYIREPFFGTSYAWGNASINEAYEKAQRYGDIKSISYADYEFLNVIGIFQMVTVEVHGD